MMDGVLEDPVIPAYLASELLANLVKEDAVKEQAQRIKWAKEDGDAQRVDALEGQMQILEAAFSSEIVQGDLTRQPGEMSADDVYNYMALRLGGRRQASEYRKGMGVPGAGTTSGISDGTSFVVCDFGR